MKYRIVFAALTVSLTLAWESPGFAQADASAGQMVFTQKCASCHTITADQSHGLLGPSLTRVIGRAAAEIPGWEFSPALRESKLVWTDENLQKWLADPAVLVPGSQMLLKMPNRFEREDVIAYLRTLKGAEGTGK